MSAVTAVKWFMSVKSIILNVGVDMSITVEVSRDRMELVVDSGVLSAKTRVDRG